MVLVEERPTSEAVEAAPGSRRWTLTAILAVAAFAGVVAAFWISWPVGVVLGLVLGTLVTVQAGRVMHRAAQHVETADDIDDVRVDDDLRREFRRLRVRLGDDWTDFGRAAALVTRTQAASLASLQRELAIPTARAQTLMRLLEREGFVGPARGGRRREVRVPQERTEELQLLLAG